jgi:hypothetical protein
MKLHAFRITINRRPPFVGMFSSTVAVIEAFEQLAFEEAESLGGFKLSVVALHPAQNH